MNVFTLLDHLRIIGQNGVEYADNPYDKQRYERLLELTSRCYGETLEIPPAKIREELRNEFGHVTPKIGSGTVVFDDEGRVLLIKRSDDRKWCRPCGFVEPGETPEEAAVRETKEETGLEVETQQLTGVYTRKPGEHGPHSLVAHVYLSDVVGGEIETGHESEDVQFWEIDEVPEWHKDHKKAVEDAHEIWKKG